MRLQLPTRRATPTAACPRPRASPHTGWAFRSATQQCLLGGALSPPEVQSRVRAILAPRIKATQDLGHELGVGEVSLLPVSNADEFGRVNDRLDSDELGLAARVEKATSRRHRHLLLLGMHVGVPAALTDMSGGKLQNPLRQYIGRHHVGRVPPTGWEPAARAGEGTTPEQKAAAYQAALTALDRAVSELGPMR
jgi:hypothetical protein